MMRATREAIHRAWSNLHAREAGRAALDDLRDAAQWADPLTIDVVQVRSWATALRNPASREEDDEPITAKRSRASRWGV